jgi:hypothetical protein
MNYYTTINENPEEIPEDKIKELAESIFTFNDYATNKECNYTYIIDKMVELCKAANTMPNRNT